MVGRGPSVALDGEYFYSEQLWPFCGARGDLGKVLVKIDRYDPEHVFCFHLDGRPICEARTRARVNALALTEAERQQIGEAERIKWHQRDRAYTALGVETGGTFRLADPRDRIRMLAEGLPAEAMERVGGRSSVKGGSHRFEHYRLPVPGEAEREALPPAAGDAPGEPTGAAVIEFRPERNAAADEELAAAHAALTAAVRSDDEEQEATPAPVSARLFAQDDGEED
jgi:hypothetical protein